MTFKEVLLSDMKEAIRNHDTIVKNTIQSIRASILQEEKDKQIETTDKDVENIIMKEKKKRQDALEQFEKAGREDLIMQTKREIQILEGYLPEQISPEDLELEVAKIINQVDAHSIKDMGIVMRAAKEQFGNQVDGKELSGVVKRKLGEL